jgi:hypothetical protein
MEPTWIMHFFKVTSKTSKNREAHKNSLKHGKRAFTKDGGNSRIKDGGNSRIKDGGNSRIKDGGNSRIKDGGNSRIICKAVCFDDLCEKATWE